MCLWNWWTRSDKPFVVVPGQMDTIPGCDPTPEWLAGEMPSRTLEDLVEHLKYRESIHLTYYDKVTEDGGERYLAFGDANFHLWAIEGYDNALLVVDVMKQLLAGHTTLEQAREILGRKEPS